MNLDIVPFLQISVKRIRIHKFKSGTIFMNVVNMKSVRRIKFAKPSQKPFPKNFYLISESIPNADSILTKMTPLLKLPWIQA